MLPHLSQAGASPIIEAFDWFSGFAAAVKAPLASAAPCIAWSAWACVIAEDGLMPEPGFASPGLKRVIGGCASILAGAAE